MQFNNLSDLEKYLTKQIKDSLEKDVVSKAKQLVEDHIQKDVYDVYTPKKYVRSYNLQKAVSSKVEDDTSVNIYIDDNIAQSYHMNDPNEALEPYASYVESGEGYDYYFDYFGKPRPFMKNAKADLEKGLAKEYLKEALKKRGLKVEG